MWKAHKTIREPYLWANLPPTTIIRIGTDLLFHVNYSEDTFFLKKKWKERKAHREVELIVIQIYSTHLFHEISYR